MNLKQKPINDVKNENFTAKETTRYSKIEGNFKINKKSIDFIAYVEVGFNPSNSFVRNSSITVKIDSNNFNINEKNVIKETIKKQLKTYYYETISN